MLLTTKRTDLAATAFVAKHARVFTVFDATTQDSGNVSYGASLGTQRVFVKTAGSALEPAAVLSHDERVSLLHNAVRIAHSLSDPVVPALLNVVECVDGPVLIYDWVEGELLRSPSLRRSDPSSAFARFSALHSRERIAALDLIFRLHVKLRQRGWIAGDFYDGCLIYDFARSRLRVVDLDNYRDAPFINDRGRMFGSSRFMAPEENLLGAPIDERTTVFTMGRTIQQFLGTDVAGAKLVSSRACEPDPERRFGSLAEFYEAWSALTHGAGNASLP
jgi:serine/threonine protein kinase